MWRSSLRGAAVASLLVVALSLGLGHAPVAHAATFNVDTTEDDPSATACSDAAPGDCSLRGAIAAASALTGPSLVTVPAGTYALSAAGSCTVARPGRGAVTYTEISLCLTGAVTLQGAGADTTIIQGNGLNRVLFVAPTAVAEVRDVAIENGRADRSFAVNPHGGGIYNEGTLVLTQVTVMNNGLDPGATGGTGAGIFNADGAALTLLRGLVALNSAPAHQGGGGIATTLASTLTVADSVIRDNASGLGGGIYNNGGTVTITGTTITGNSGSLGGGIANFGSGIDTTVFRGDLTLVNSTVSGNASGGSGGGIYNHFFTVIRLNNVTITGNRTTGTVGTGGGIFTRETDGIFVGNTIIAGNTDVGAAPDCDARSAAASAALTSLGHNLVQNTTNCVIVGDTTGNITGQDPRLGALALTGGATPTHALLADSPALDAGSPSPPGSGGNACAAVDQRGIDRLQDGGSGARRCDMGAHEVPQGGGVFAVTGVRPAIAGNAGSVLAMIHGSGFAQGAVIKLARAGHADIPGEMRPSEGGAVLAALFDLRGKAAGAWDVVVTNPGGASVTRPGALTIEAGGAPRLWADVVGPGLVRAGRPARFTVLFGNRGTIDAAAVPLVISLPLNVGLTVRVPVTPPPAHPQQVSTDWGQVPVIVQGDTLTYVPLVLPLVPAGFTQAIEVTVVPPLDGTGQQFQVVAEVGRSYLEPGHVDLLVDGARGYAQRVLGTSIPDSLVPQMQQYAITQLQSMVDAGRAQLLGRTGAEIEIYGSAQLVVDVAKFGAARTVAQVNGAPRSTEARSWRHRWLAWLLRVVAFLFEPAAAYADTVSSCAEQGLAFDPKFRRCVPPDCGHGIAVGICSGGGGSSPTTVGSHDPNDKAGASGPGAARFVGDGQPLRYAIFFENLETATAAAQEVIVTDDLDGAQLDLDTLSLGPISFGDVTVTPPPGLREYSTTVDLRPAMDLVVGIDARLDRTTGRLTWRFTSLDPLTGQLTEDAAAGFLPPNVNPPEGDGSVVFTIQPKTAGIPICNSASIVFDVNAPIVTPEWCNTIDATAPSSQVLPLAPTQTSPAFEVRWSGTDSEAGIASYSVFVSENRGPYELFLSDTTETSAIFTGVAGNAYAFYSVAQDQAGNVEAAPGSPDTQTTVGGGGGGGSDHDLAVTAIKAPAVVTLTGRVPERAKRVTVQIQNRSRHTETISDANTLRGLVTLDVISLGGCPAPAAVLSPPAKFPMTLKPKQQLGVAFDVTFDCANDPAKSTGKDPGHHDYRLTARVDHAALGGTPDAHPADDVCPRSVTPPFEIDPNPDGTIKDKGCGAKKADKTLGGPVLVDVVVGQ